MKCFLLTAYPYPSGSYTWKTCGNTSSLKPRTASNGVQGVYWEVDGADMFGGSYVLPSSTVSVVAWDTPATYGDCDSCKIADPDPDTSKYDCINGVCTPNANGFYPSLSACQTACGKQGCSGQCVSSSDWAQIEGLINQLKNRSCS